MIVILMVFIFAFIIILYQAWKGIVNPKEETLNDIDHDFEWDYSVPDLSAGTLAAQDYCY